MKQEREDEQLCMDAEFEIHQDIEYYENPEDDKNNYISKNKLDLFMPKNSDVNTPIVVFVHGGGWSRGCRRAYKHFLSFYDTNLLFALLMAYHDAFWNVGKGFARAGIACAVISYRLSRLEFPWLLVRLCLSFLQSVIVVFTPLFFVAVLAIYVSNIACNDLQNGVSNRSYLIPNHYNELLPSSLTFYILIILSVFILWSIVCHNPNSYLMTLHTSLYPLIISLVCSITYILLWKVQIISFLSCFTICLIMSLLHSFAMFQQSNCPATKHPGHVLDVAKSVAWVINHGENTQQFDASKVFLCGHSAGGHLVSLLALDPKYLNSVGLSPSLHIKGVISVSGVYDLQRLAGGARLLENAYLRPAFGRNPDTWTLASPYHRLRLLYKTVSKSNDLDNPGTSTEGTCIPNIPFLVINAELDFQLNEDGRQFVSMLKMKGFSCKHFIVKRTNHFSVIFTFGKLSQLPAKENTTESLCLKFVRQCQYKSIS